MGKPKKRTSSRRSGMGRSHLLRKLAIAVNAKSPVKVLIKGRRAAKKAKIAAKKAATATKKTA